MTVLAPSAFPQPSETKTAKAGIDRGAVQTVIALARNAPPEFSADALITLVENDLVPDRRAQRSLLEEAFAVAAGAQEKIALKRGAGDSPVTSALHGAFRNGIDQVSLRSRVVEAMLKLDARTARELFDKIDLPIELSSGCAQQTVPDLSHYYVAMFEVVRHIPEHAQVEAFLLAHMLRFTSTAQITPFARVFLQVRGIERMPAVIDAYAARLPELISDTRIFSTDFDSSIEAIGQLLGEVSSVSRDHLIRQSRAWVLANARQGVCAETQKYAVSFNGLGRVAIPYIDPAEKFNQEVAWRSRTNVRIERGEIAFREMPRVDSAVPSLVAISVKSDSEADADNRNEAPAPGITAEPAPVELSTTASAAAQSAPTQPAVNIPNSPEYLENFQTHLALSRDDENALSLPLWRDQLQNYISRLAAWQCPEANEPRFYLEKSDLLSQILFIDRHAPPPPGAPIRINWSGNRRPEGPRLEIPGHDRVMAALMDLFASETAAKVYSERRLVWFSPVRDLLGLYDRTDRTFAIADLYAATDHPVLSLYGRLAKLVAARERDF